MDDAWTIEQILSEKRVFDLTANFQKSDIANTSLSWSMPC